MRAHRVIQDAGRQRPLNVGEVYDLPDVVATAFIATGVAVAEPSHETREVAVIPGAPERAEAPASRGRQR